MSHEVPAWGLVLLEVKYRARFLKCLSNFSYPLLTLASGPLLNVAKMPQICQVSYRITMHSLYFCSALSKDFDVREWRRAVDLLQ